MTRNRESAGVRELAVLTAAIVVLYVAREIFVPVSFAVILTFVLAPVVGSLQRIHLSRVPSALIVMAMTIAVGGAISWMLAGQLIDVANQLPAYRENIHRKVEAMRAPAKGALARAATSVDEIKKELVATEKPAAATPVRRVAGNTVPPSAGGPVPVQVVVTGTGGLEYVRELVQPFLAPLATFGVVLILTIFMLIEREDLRNRLLRLVGVPQLNLATQALDEAARRVSRYLLLQILVNSALGAVFGLGLHLIGVPYAALWGTVTAILRIVPYFGAFAAALLPVTLSLAVFDGWLRPTIVFVLFTLLELTVSNLVEPLLYGSHTGISSLGLLVTAIFWTFLWGYPGLVLSTPLTVCAAVLGRYVPQLAFLHILLGDEPVLGPDAQLYQRLLAMDQVEARAVAAAYLKDRPLVELYDLVVIPAMTMAEHDRHKGTLDPVRQEFLFLTLMEMIGELGDRNDPGNELETVVRPFAGRVFCVPARTEADEIASAMLGHLLERAGCAAITFPARAASALSSLNPSEGDVICVSALPPLALNNATSLCSRLRARYPGVRLLIGLWGYAGDPGRAAQRFEVSRPVELITSLAQALESVSPKVSEQPDPVQAA